MKTTNLLIVCLLLAMVNVNAQNPEAEDIAKKGFSYLQQNKLDLLNTVTNDPLTSKSLASAYEAGNLPKNPTVFNSKKLNDFLFSVLCKDGSNETVALIEKNQETSKLEWTANGYEGDSLLYSIKLHGDNMDNYKYKVVVTYEKSGFEVSSVFEGESFSYKSLDISTSKLKKVYVKRESTSGDLPVVINKLNGNSDPEKDLGKGFQKDKNELVIVLN